MKTRPLFMTILTLALLTTATWGGYTLGLHFHTDAELVSNFPIPPLAPLYLPAQTQNGITASVESYYADANRLFFVIHIEGGKLPFLDLLSLRDSENREINTAYGVGNFDNDASTFFVDFTPVTTLQIEQLNGHLSFAVYSTGENSAPETFSFDLNIPIHPARTYDLKETVKANGVEILLDRVIVTPAYTQTYLCYDKPTSADWMIGQHARLQINEKSSGLSEYALLFDSDFGDIGKGGDPDWTPPIDDGRCVKIGFPIGDANPETLMLTIPTLEQSMPEVIPDSELAKAYKILEAHSVDMEWHIIDHGAYPEYKKLPSGVSQQEAYEMFLRALGYFHDGPWVFDVKVQR